MAEPPAFAVAFDRLLQKLMPKRRSREAPLSPQGLPYASFERRMLAMTLDAALVALIMAPFNGMITRAAYQADPAALQALLKTYATPEAAQAAFVQTMQSGVLLKGVLALAQIQFGILATYSFIFWHFYAATPGKLLLRMRIVSAKTGERISDNQGLLRIVG
ncbi:MAG: RDD family protein, partial [Alphaproteobacteria bacterium]|nr:RDD family protein [Alphaproteobacteria bacterium]